MIVAVLTVMLVVLAGPGTAGAHGGQGSERPPASNYRTEIVSAQPAVDGVSVSVVDAGSRLELRNTSDVDVVVFGYDGDPYLRVGPDGVFENSHSAAVFLNAERFGGTPIPVTVNSDAEPVWRRVSSEQAVRWHDHRAHWMNEAPPATVSSDPDRSTQRISEWTVPLAVDGKDVTVSGTLDWIEPPSPLWWWFVALASVAAVLLAGRRWRTGTPMVASVVLLVATVVNAAGAWAATPGGIVLRVGALTVPVMLWSLLCAGMVLMRRNRMDALLLIGAASAGLAGVFGLVDLGWLNSAVVPSALVGVVASATVALAMGVGTGLAVHAGLDAGPALYERAAARRSAARRAADADPSQSASPVRLLRRQRWLLVLPVLAVLVGIGVMLPSSDTSATTDPALGDDVCAATSGPATEVHDELHVRLHQVVTSTADIDLGAAQRLSDTVDELDPADPTADAADELRADVDAALVANGQDRLDCRG